jgi:hypothetical protein
MTDRYKVYTKVLKSIKEVVQNQHPGHTMTWAMMITGIVLSSSSKGLIWWLIAGWLRCNYLATAERLKVSAAHKKVSIFWRSIIAYSLNVRA